MDFKMRRRRLGNTRGTLLCASVGYFVLLCMGSVEAQSLSTSEAQPASTRFADEYEQALKRFKVESEQAEQKGSTREPAIPLGVAPTPTLNVIYRGRDGIAFPDPSQVVLKPIPTPTVDPSTPTPVPTPTPWEKPGRCQLNETTVIDHHKDGDPRTLLYDLLFVSEDLVPLNPEEVFGGSVTLYPYGPKSGDAAVLLQKAHDVPCVPFRVRLTGRGYRYDHGNNALKNYSKDQAGKGYFHPWIEQKLFGTGKPTTRRSAR